MIGIRRSVSVSAESGGLDGVEERLEAVMGSGWNDAIDLEKSSVEASVRCDAGEIRWGSKSNEIGSSAVKVNDRNRADRFGVCELSADDIVSGLVANIICERSCWSFPSSTGPASFRPAHETSRMEGSTLGTMPAFWSLTNVWVCSERILAVGGELGGFGLRLGKSKGLPPDGCR